MTLTIERPAALGRSIAHRDGMAVLVARGLPGEVVTAAVERVQPRFALATVVQVEQP
nr:TRAM domain-containing protein [Gammaproteobacteria bacterium]